MFNPRQGSNPAVFALVPATGTAYAVNPGGERFLAAISIKRCNALTTRGCRVEAPTAPLNLAFPDIDRATDTIYAADRSTSGIEVLNGAKCNAHDLSGCKPVAKIPFAHPDANLGSIDHATHTLYADDTFSNTVWAIDIKRCNAQDTSGCSASPAKMKVGPSGGFPVLDPATHTLYTPGATPQASMNSNHIYVDNAATCNAQVTSGCGQKAATVTVGTNTFVLALNTMTDTIYAPSLGPNFLGRTVWVISGAVCNASDHSDCSSAVVAKAKVGAGPSSAVVDQSTNTVYVGNNAHGDFPGTVSVINGATCNGTNTSSCSRPKPTVTVGRSPLGMALGDNHRLYVADYADAAVSIIDTSRCNAADTKGCGKPAAEQAIGSQPDFVLYNKKTRTVYATVRFIGSRGVWSIFPAAP